MLLTVVVVVLSIRTCTGLPCTFVNLGCPSQQTDAPTAAPTASQTTEPTAVPTALPTAAPTASPTAGPTAAPTALPRLAEPPAEAAFLSAVKPPSQAHTTLQYSAENQSTVSNVAFAAFSGHFGSDEFWIQDPTSMPLQAVGATFATKFQIMKVEDFNKTACLASIAAATGFHEATTTARSVNFVVSTSWHFQALEEDEDSIL
eukprot:TRINITY_DN26679_c0_g1_i1.p1 TRINITY_DN26679_c0_g1~~TRINITY_DN26679_c0_g1_i1.p1  ORF type:complete len:203 (+),score=23.43 TRINITY_DN26679_c0_g1_i1:122-730(+)